MIPENKLLVLIVEGGSTLNALAFKRIGLAISL